jgi:hypothetical protein
VSQLQEARSCPAKKHFPFKEKKSAGGNRKEGGRRYICPATAAKEVCVTIELTCEEVTFEELQCVLE